MSGTWLVYPLKYLQIWQLPKPFAAKEGFHGKPLSRGAGSGEADILAAFAHWWHYAARWLGGLALIALGLVVMVFTQVVYERFARIGIAAGCLLIFGGSVLLIQTVRTHRYRSS